MYRGYVDSGTCCALTQRGGSEVCMAGPLREVVSTSEEKEEAAGGGGAQKRKKPEDSLVQVQRYKPRQPRVLPTGRSRR